MQMMDKSFCAHGYTISGHYPCCPWKSACVGVLLVFIQFLVYSLYLGTVHATHILTVLLFGSARTYIPHSQLCHCIKLQCNAVHSPRHSLHTGSYPGTRAILAGCRPVWHQYKDLGPCYHMHQSCNAMLTLKVYAFTRQAGNLWTWAGNIAF